MREVEELLDELRPVVGDEAVLAAIASVPRERFVAPEQRERAYDNCALPIGHGQTISQPLVVARMLTLLELRPSDRVLDVGTGSGYHAALLARLAGQVITIERHRELAARAAALLAELGIGNVHCVHGDGAEGFPQAGPYDAVNVAAASPSELPAALGSQLAPGARLVAPLGAAQQQRLILVRRTPAGLTHTPLEAVRFVPLVREQAGR